MIAQSDFYMTVTGRLASQSAAAVFTAPTDAAMRALAARQAPVAALSSKKSSNKSKRRTSA